MAYNNGKMMVFSKGWLVCGSSKKAFFIIRLKDVNSVVDPKSVSHTNYLKELFKTKTMVLPKSQIELKDTKEVEVFPNCSLQPSLYDQITPYSTVATIQLPKWLADKNNMDYVTASGDAVTNNDPSEGWE